MASLCRPVMSRCLASVVISRAVWLNQPCRAVWSATAIRFVCSASSHALASVTEAAETHSWRSAGLSVLRAAAAVCR
ncbi:hypothetical protein GCM10010178_72580 [Lentzea flava]|uniref:Secreted protein n=1 Tax=Lentzea flava TaxID=103732 RepID=A0ABQ2V8T8_9PSEU|nr:hypothetical protein GCM10010178_72580 [Lentzea flava]